MKLRTLIAAISLLALPSVAFASGLWPDLPASTSPGTAPTTTAPTTATGAVIPTAGCIPMSTGFASGINPSDMCVSPNQLATYGAPGGALFPVLKVTNIPIGSVAYGSLGTNTTPVAGTIYFTQINLPAMTVTNIGCLNGGTAATDKLIYGLYNSAGTLVANTALAGVLAANADTFQQIALTATYTAVAGQYYIGWQTNGTTTRVRTIAASTFIQMLTTSQTGTFGTMAAIGTIPTTVTADVGPICYVN